MYYSFDDDGITVHNTEDPSMLYHIDEKTLKQEHLPKGTIPLTPEELALKSVGKTDHHFETLSKMTKQLECSSLSDEKAPKSSEAESCMSMAKDG